MLHLIFTYTIASYACRNDVLTYVLVQCTYDHTPGASALRSRRVRAYVVLEQPNACAFWESWTSYLIIDNLTHNDSGEYVCRAWSEDTAEAKANSLKSQTLVLQLGKM